MPGLGGGLGGAVGIAAESTYGTFVAPTRWVEVHSAKLQQRKHVVQGEGLAYGRVIEPGARRVNVWNDAGGEIEFEVLNSGFALLLQHIMGSSATLSQISTTTAYQLSTTLGVPDNQNYLSMQALVPDTSGTIHPENFHGCKLQKAEFTAELGGLVTCALTVDAQQVEGTTVAGTPTYTTSAQPFSPLGMSFKVGPYGSEATLDGVKKASLSIERTLKTDRIYLGQSFKEEPVTNGWVKLTGSFDVDLTSTNKAVIWDAFAADTSVSVILDFVGSSIGSSGHNNELKLNATDCFFDSGGTPELDGPDLVTATIPWSALIDAANDPALTAVLTTADTTF